VACMGRRLAQATDRHGSKGQGSGFAALLLDPAAADKECAADTNHHGLAAIRRALGLAMGRGPPG